MLITLTMTAPDAATPATDLGFLLHKHPDRLQSFDVAMGVAQVCYPEATPERCTVALVLEVDPIALVRGRKNGPGAFELGQYVNDRPYAASSFLAVALGNVFRTALSGRCDQRPQLAAEAVPLEVNLPSLPCRNGAELIERLFAPLGWAVETTKVPLDPAFPEWGDSRYFSVRLAGRLRLADALTSLYVLLPVLDNAKHYWVAEDEVDKLLRAGGDWLAAHPERELITQRYLKHRRAYVQSALAQLAEADDIAPEALDDALDEPVVTELPDRPEPLAMLRRGSVLAALRASGARRVLDLGCGGGALLHDLLADPSFTEIVGLDVSAHALELAARKLKLDRRGERARDRITLRQSSLTYRDRSLEGYDAAVLMEVIEHVDPDRLPALERSVFQYAKPVTVVVTTPNVEYNVRFPTLPEGHSRHRDHRFEWTRAEFRDWAEGVAERRGYDVRYLPVGPDDPEVGPPTQLAVFTREEAA